MVTEKWFHYSITRIVVYIKAIDLFHNDSYLFILLINVIYFQLVINF